MKKLLNLSFISRLFVCMTLSLALNLGAGYYLKAELSQNKYLVSLDVDYSVAGTLQLLFDTGTDFNPIQQLNVEVAKGVNSLKLPFEVKEGGQIKFLRLDFGNNNKLTEVKLNSFCLTTENNILFDLDEPKISKSIILFHEVKQVDSTGVLAINYSKGELDPYVVFRPINELMRPLWQRTLLLVIPWIVIFFFPVFNWVRQRFKKKELALFFAALFMASVPLKIAWVTFTALLLLTYSLFILAKKKKIDFSIERLAVLGLFVVPLLFIGQGEFSNLSIALGFIIFPIVFSILDFTAYYDRIKEIYTKVFFILMSIAIVSWLLFMGYTGYFYNIDLSNYLRDVKANAHLVLDWLYYPHTTFLSFFILVGGIFCWDLFKQQKITKIYGALFSSFTIFALLILGSRFAIALALLLPILYFIPVYNLKRTLIPLWGALFAGIVYFIDKLDLLRAELWQISFSEIKKNLWFGNGTGTSDLVLPNQLLIEKNGVEALIGINHSHNQFLTSLLENGLLGTLFFLAFMLFIFYHFFKQNDKTMMLVTFSFLLLMVVESPFQTATPLYLFSFLMCCFLRHPKKKI